MPDTWNMKLTVIEGFDGQKMSNDHSIKVEWAAATAPPPKVVQAGDNILNVNGGAHYGHY